MSDRECVPSQPLRPWGWTGAVSVVDAEEQRRKWRGWRRLVFPGIWLVYLGQTGAGVSKHSSGAAAVVGFVLIGVFCVCYLQALYASWADNRRRYWLLCGAMVVCCAVETLFAHEDAFVMCIYIGVLSVGAMRRHAWVAIGVLTLIVTVVPPAIPSWHAGFKLNDALTIPLVGLAMWGFFGVIRTNQALAHARSEVARLAAENERTRIARDLHDLLGHSLTTITVKAGLARRLAQRGDMEWATAEIGEVEELSRGSLADVRAAVAGHRDVTLAGEIATSREVLRASGIIAELPASVEIVDPTYRELFGWVTREGVTNVVRHARAAHCTIRVDRNWIEIADDGRGGVIGAGNGLTGLRERVEAAGGTVRVDAAPARGWLLRAEMPAVSDPSAAVDDTSTMSA